MSSNLKVNTILPSTGTTIGIGTVGGLINVVGNIDVNSTSGISTFNGLEISGIVTAKAGAAVTYYGDGSNLTGITQTTINSNTNNYLITGTGTANTLQGESNLTFDGSILSITGEITPSSHINLASGKKLSMAGDVFKIYHSTNAAIINESGDLIINQNVSNKDIKISTGSGPTERLRIDSDGRVGIKNTNMSSFNTGMDDLVIGNGVSNTSPGMTIFSHATDIGTISFRDSADTGISGLIQYRHLESPPYMRFMVEGTQRMSITTHGGIAFNSDTAAANTLDDYEEGSWTPTLENAGSTTYSTQNGKYTRIGNVVYITATIIINSHDGSSNSVTGFQNLPYANNSNGQTVVFHIAGNEHWDTDLRNNNLTGWLTNGSTTIRLYKNSGNNLNAIIVDDIGNNGEVYVSGHYFIS